MTAVLGASNADIAEHSGHLLDALVGNAARVGVHDQEPHDATTVAR